MRTSTQKLQEAVKQLKRPWSVPFVRAKASEPLRKTTADRPTFDLNAKGDPSFPTKRQVDAGTDWNEVLNRPEMDYATARYYYHLANDWPTCAVGNLCQALPRDPGGTPTDPKLRKLGMDFTTCWVEIYRELDPASEESVRKPWAESYWRGRTITMMAAIEQRSTELLHEQMYRRPSIVRGTPPLSRV